MLYTGSDVNNPTQLDINISTMAAIKDGTSNTILVAERVGGGTIYFQGGKAAPAVSPWNELAATNGGGWGDILNGDHWHAGFLYSFDPAVTPMPQQGPCGINCTNLRGHSFYSFHPGGAQFLLADGSVRFVSETVAQFVLASMITRAKGEVFTMP